MNKLVSWDELKNILLSSARINLYGAGVRLNLFFGTLDEAGIKVDINSILVSNKCGNPDTVRGIPVVGIAEAELDSKDVILLTVSECYISEICGLIEKKHPGASIWSIDYEIIDSFPRERVYKSIQTFVDHFPDDCVNLNIPEERQLTLWTCWWQGEEDAPELVKACWKSWDKYAPKGMERVVITKNNYKDYVDIPEYILKKVNDGKILLAHLSDIIRVSLLYKYGGLWLDATIYMNDKMPIDIFEYDIYTRNVYGREFGSNATWAIWYLYAKKGEKLFKFVMEAYFYYFERYDEVLYYLMTDYIIGIACNQFPEITEKLNRIPYNNVKAMDLMRHLYDKFDEIKFREYTEGGYIQKLSRHGNNYREDSVYQYIVHTYMTGTEIALEKNLVL